MPDLIIGQRVVGGVEVVTLLAIPFFVFASDLMARGRMAAQLADLFRALVGHYRGGIGHSTVVTCMVFGAAAGSAPATVAAMGRLSYPELRRAGFSDKFSLGLIASSAECALLIPPSITFVVYSWLTGTSIAALFAAGLIIGIVLGLAFMVLVAIEAWRVGAALGERYSGRRALEGVPRGVLGAADAGDPAGRHFLRRVHRDRGCRGVGRLRDRRRDADLPRVRLARAVRHRQGQRGLDRRDLHPARDGRAARLLHHAVGARPAVLALVREIGVHWVVFMLIVNIVFLTCAMFLDPNSIMVIFLPTLFPVAAALGIDPVHFGMVVTLNVCTGMIMPPLGLDLAVAASTLNRPMEAVVAGIWPFIVTNVVVLILISYIPPLSTFLPKIFGV